MTRKNRLIKWMEENRRKTTSREEKFMIGFAKGGETGKIIDLARNHKPLRL
jgi:hypothetical protein